ncbi:hypothetical protein TNCV_1996571 [Trichonephila clavipes]|uniref:Uncharacterized protein n=1 Tax=Trichonephila clavipes TaxID=2585209 RepID=A0A8X6RMH1_TRICX|nr:hypothetical protein TNCV_1996571 [Trichonephila clavipes]
MLENVIENWTSRLDYIRASRGSHMPEIIFKICRDAIYPPQEQPKKSRQPCTTQQSKPSATHDAAKQAVRPAWCSNLCRQTHMTQQSMPSDPNDATATNHTLAITTISCVRLSTD